MRCYAYLGRTLFSASASDDRTPAHYVNQSVCLQIWDVGLPQIFSAKGLQELKNKRFGE
jgi:hypothetical protein